METIKEEIEKHIPCEVCGNKEISRFTLRGTIRSGQKSLMIKCDECNEVYNVERKNKK